MSLAFGKKSPVTADPARCNAMCGTSQTSRGYVLTKGWQKMRRATVFADRPGRSNYVPLLLRTYLGQALAFLGPSPRRRRSPLRFLGGRGRRTTEVTTPTALLGVLPPAASVHASATLRTGFEMTTEKNRRRGPDVCNSMVTKIVGWMSKQMQLHGYIPRANEPHVWLSKHALQLLENMPPRSRFDYELPGNYLGQALVTTTTTSTTTTITTTTTTTITTTSATTNHNNHHHLPNRQPLPLPFGWAPGRLWGVSP